MSLALLLAFGLGWGEVYLFCLFVGLAFAIITGLLAGVGGHTGPAHEIGGHDFAGHEVDIGGQDFTGHDADAVAHDLGSHDLSGHDLGGDGTVHFSPLSPVVVAMFVTSFGAIGLLGEAGWRLPWWLHLPMATTGGLVFAAVSFYLFARLFLWAQGSSQVSVREAMGGQAEVIIPIPVNGVGRISYRLEDRRFTAAARSVDGQAVPNHAIVIITDVSGSTFLVRPSDEEQLRRLSGESQPAPR